VILTLATGAAAAQTQPAASVAASGRSVAVAKPAVAPASPTAPDASFEIPYAGPSVRKRARERGIDLHLVKGSGPRGRILPADVAALAAAPASEPVAKPAVSAGAAAGLDLLPWPKVDFAKFGPVETKPLSRIKKISAGNLHRNWVMIPHVTS